MTLSKPLPQWAILIGCMLCAGLIYAIVNLSTARVFDRASANAERTRAKNYEVVEKVSIDQDTSCATGVLRYTGDKPHVMGVVGFDVFNDNDEFVGNAADVVRSLPKGQKWRYSARYVGKDGAKWRLHSVTFR